MLKSHPTKAKVGRSVAKPACVPVREGMEPGGTSLQAVSLNPEICLVVVIRITSGTSEGKPTLSTQRKAAVQTGRETGAPAGHHRGLESRACTQGDNSGT